MTKITLTYSCFKAVLAIKCMNFSQMEDHRNLVYDILAFAI